MPSTVKILRSTTPGATPTSLSSGQIAINEADGILFYRNAAGAVSQFTSGGGGGGSSSLAVYASVSAFPATGSASVLYLAEDTSRLYQWESPVYVEAGGSGGGVAHAATHAIGGGDSITITSEQVSDFATAAAAAAPATTNASLLTSGTLDDARLSFVPLHPFLLMGG